MLDEWVIHDLRGENGAAAQAEANEFLTSLHERCDRIAVIKGSPWMQKAYKLMTGAEPRVRSLSKFLHLSILKDPKKCTLLEASSLARIPESLAACVPSDDLYLLETYFASGAEAIVTSDQTLLKAA